MKNTFIIFLLIIMVFSAGCSAGGQVTVNTDPVEKEAAQVEPPTDVPAATQTSAPTETSAPTAIPSPTAFPGTQVYPIESLASEIPWLPLSDGKRPAVNYIGFNNQQPPFDQAAVRLAFSYAVDRDVIVEMMRKYGARDAQTAAIFTPPQTLGRDVSGEMGVTFDPQKAKAYLQEAGYEDPSGFPEVTYLVNVAGENAPGAHLNVANTIADMWQTHLGVKVNVVLENNWETYLIMLRDDPPEIYRMGWVADYNDPDNFLKTMLHSGAELNNGRYSNPDFDALVNQAAEELDPAERMSLYLQAERILIEEDAGVIALYHCIY